MPVKFPRASAPPASSSARIFPVQPQSHSATSSAFNGIQAKWLRSLESLFRFAGSASKQPDPPLPTRGAADNSANLYQSAPFHAAPDYTHSFRPGIRPALRRPLSFLLLLIAVTLAVNPLRAGVISGTVNPAADSVVYVNTIAGKKFPAPVKPFSMNQKNLLFQPHVLAVPQGATVNFLNSDRTRHNIFWPSVNGDKNLSHNLGTWPQGQIRPFQFTTAGIVPLGCNVHPDMSGYIVVSPTPYFALTDAAGNFTITGVPAGAYTISAWHEGMKIQSQPVTVPGVAKVAFTLAK